jgi:hypothetical protein
MAELFISYSHADLKPVSKMAGQLEQRGHEVWWDQRLRGGQDFGPAIEEALENSKCAVVAWSKSARSSLWVRAEATLAWESGKLVQLSLDGAKPPLPFTMIQLLDFSGWQGTPSEPAFVHLERSVDGVLQGGSPPVAAQPPPAGHLAGFGPTAVVGGASLALVVLAGGLVGLGSSGVFSPGAFGAVSGSMLLVAMLAFGYMLTRVITTYLASRR